MPHAASIWQGYDQGLSNQLYAVQFGTIAGQTIVSAKLKRGNDLRTSLTLRTYDWGVDPIQSASWHGPQGAGTFFRLSVQGATVGLSVSAGNTRAASCP